MTNALDLLPECSWRGISFPVASLRTTLKQDLVEHKYWGVNGARVESTGRAPYVIEVVIPFRNGIAKSKNETWASGNLYPGTWQTFITACALTTAGIFVHPALGQIKCKASVADMAWEANRRDGVDVHATFTETLDETVKVATSTQASSLANSAVDLDSLIGQLTPPPTTPTYKPNFADTVRSVVAVGDTVSLLQKQQGGQLSNLAYRAGQIQNSALAAKNALMWPIVTATEKLRSGTNAGTKTNLLQERRSTSFYIVPQRTTLAALVSDIAESNISDLIKLNPTLVANPSVIAGTVVRYYTSRTT